MESLRLRKFKIVAGTHYGTPKEVWGFRTKSRRGNPVNLARKFLDANQDLLGLKDLEYFPRPRVIESLGARHIIFQQRLENLPILRAYVTVHMARNGSAYLVKNRAVPRDLAHPSAEFRITSPIARRRGLASVTKRPGSARVTASERIWFPLQSRLRPSYRVNVRRRKPREDWIIFVDGETGRILRKYDNLASVTGFASVFDPNPVIALGGSNQLIRNSRLLPPPPTAYAKVTLHNLKTTGRLDGWRVTTKPTPRRVRRTDRRFHFTSDDPAFEEVMVYFHIDRSIRYLESLGFRGPRAIFQEPMPVNANGTEEDNSWYSPHERNLTFGLGGVDDAEDAEIILHELGHAIQDAICPGFGQSAEAAAMGEGFGDYFAASFFAAGKPPRYRTSVGTWDAIESGDYDPPCLRRVDEQMTYEVFDHNATADEHANGQIWSATLWDIWTALGRDIADVLVLESHFQLDGFTTFARGARAIIDADRNLYRGRHVAQLQTIFHRRGIGPVE